MRHIEIRYHDKTTKKLCTDFKHAKKHLNAVIAEKLFALVNFLESSDTLQDIAVLSIYHLHPMIGDRKGQYALDIVGRKAGYRLLIVPLDKDGREFLETDINKIYQSTKIIIAWEVSNHYE